MKMFYKFQRLIAACMLTLVLFTTSVQNTVALGAYTQVNISNAEPALVEQAAFPAVAAVAFGVVLVGAFAYGVYTGYREASTGKQPSSELSMLEPYQSNDFTQFDLAASAI